MGFELVIVRPPLVYGVGAPGNFGNFIHFIAKLPILPFGCTYNLRSYISAHNLSDFIFICATHPLAANELFLVSDNDDISTKNFSNLISKKLGKISFQLPIPVSMIEFIARFLGLETQVEKLFGDLQIDSSKARKLLDWSPLYSVEKGIEKSI